MSSTESWMIKVSIYVRLMPSLYLMMCIITALAPSETRGGQFQYYLATSLFFSRFNGVFYSTLGGQKSYLLVLYVSPPVPKERYFLTLFLYSPLGIFETRQQMFLEICTFAIRLSLIQASKY